MSDVVGAILLNTGAGVLTNIATDDDPEAWAALALVTTVAALVALSLWRLRTQADENLIARTGILPELLDPPRPSAEVVTWLSAARCPAPLWSRRTESAELRDWCLGDRGWIAVVQGGSGVGKKRLAVELARTLPDEWYCGRVVSVSGVAAAIDACPGPTLVVVTDADRRTDLDELIGSLRAVRTRVRLLLCARTPMDISAAALVLRLGPIGTDNDRIRWFNEATRAFAAVWRVPPPAMARTRVGDDHDTPLDVLCRAVLAVLDRADPRGPRTMSRTELMTALWRHTVDRWAADPDLRLPASLRGDHALAELVTAALVTPSALSRVPRLATTSSDVLAGAVDWLRDRVGEPLRLAPRALADHVVLTTASRVPTIIPPDEHAIEILANALRTYPEHFPVLVDLLRSVPERVPLLTAVFEHASPTDGLDAALAELIPGRADSALVEAAAPDWFPRTRRAQLAAVVSGLPGRSSALVDALIELSELCTQLSDGHGAVRAATRAVAVGRKIGEEALIARALDARARALLRRGEVAKAHVAANEATRRYRGLAAGMPAEFTLSLAAAVHVLAEVQAELGQTRAALTHAREAVALTMSAIDMDSLDQLPRLLASLNSLGIRLHESGLFAEAVATWERIIARAAGPVAVRPDLFLTTFAAAQTNLAADLGMAGRLDEALAAAEAGVATWKSAPLGLYREMHLANYANAHFVLGSSRMAAGRVHEAGEMFDIARTLQERLAAQNPRYRPALAKTLTMSGLMHTRAGRPATGLASAEKAVVLLREADKSTPGRHIPDVNRAFHVVAICKADAGELRAALMDLENMRADALSLVRANPLRNIPPYVNQCTLAAGLLRWLGDAGAARRVLEHALDVMRAHVDASSSIAAEYASVVDAITRLVIEWEYADGRVASFAVKAE